MSQNFKTVKLEKKNQIGWIILNRPKKLNAINCVMLQELSTSINNLEKDQKIKCIIISGEGEKAFSTGADIKELENLSAKTATEFSTEGQKVFFEIENSSKPVIAAIKGYALGGGLELALACDFRIATDNAEFGCPEIKLGFSPAWGGTIRLPLIIGLSKAKQLIMTGDIIKSTQAYRHGLVDKIVPLKKLKTEVEKLAKKLCEFPLEALKQTKCFLNSTNWSYFKSNSKKETESFVLLFSLQKTKKHIHDFEFRERQKKEVSNSNKKNI
jgi:enoyl-CoA hydratase/carnithine racemase